MPGFVSGLDVVPSSRAGVEELWSCIVDQFAGTEDPNDIATAGLLRTVNAVVRDGHILLASSSKVVNDRVESNLDRITQGFRALGVDEVICAECNGSYGKSSAPPPIQYTLDGSALSTSAKKRQDRMPEGVFRPNSNHIFEHFVVGNGNQLAYLLATSIVRAYEKRDEGEGCSHEPLLPFLLYVYGDPGLGKTLLASCVANAIKTATGDESVVVMETGQRFFNRFVRMREAPADFFEQMTAGRVLILDGIDPLFEGNKEGTCQMLERVIQHCLEVSQGHVIITSNKRPLDHQVPQKASSLIQLLQGAMAEIKPDPGIIARFVGMIAEAEGYRLPDWVAAELAQRVIPVPRIVRSAVVSVSFALASQNGAATPEDVARILSDYSPSKRSADFKSILETVAEKLGLPEGWILSDRQSRQCAVARQMVARILCCCLSMKHHEIASLVGRERSTVANGIQSFEEKTKKDAKLAQIYKEVLDGLGLEEKGESR